MTPELLKSEADNCDAQSGLSPAPLLGGWREIKTCRIQDYQEVDVWMQWGASPLTFGISDSFRVANCWRVGKKWYHKQPSLKMLVSGKPGEGIITVDFISNQDANNRNGNVFISTGSAELNSDYITHWMPIPKPSNSVS